MNVFLCCWCCANCTPSHRRHRPPKLGKFHKMLKSCGNNQQSGHSTIFEESAPVKGDLTLLHRFIGSFGCDFAGALQFQNCCDLKPLRFRFAICLVLERVGFVPETRGASEKCLCVSSFLFLLLSQQHQGTKRASSKDFPIRHLGVK